MKYLLIVTLLSYGLSFWLYRAADRPGDDFGAGVIAWAAMALSGLLTLIYLALAAWHRSLL